MMTGRYVLLIPWVLAVYISVVSSQGNQDYSCNRVLEGQPVDGPCGQRCICLNGRMQYCCRQRKNFPSMTRSERLRYVNTIIRASTDRRYSSEYNQIIGTHRRLFDTGIHDKQEFLPWHRWFLLRFENLLQRIDCRVTLPYWDWSLFPGAAWNTGTDDIWSSKPWGLGGNGKRGCVQNGRFGRRKWKLTPSARRGCLRRAFSGRPPDLIALYLTKAHSPREFTEFELDVRANLHDTVHCRVGGTMCAHNSANAPEFFLHHAFIDKIWADWQEKSTSHLQVYYPNLSEDITLREAQFHPREYIDTLNMPHPDIDNEYEEQICVVYQDPVHPLYNEIMRRLERLSTAEIRRIPRRYFRPATSRQLKNLGVKRAERRKARKLLKKELEPKKRISTKQLRTLLEKMLGFRLDDIPFRFTSKDSPSRNTSLMYDRWLAKATNVTKIHNQDFKSQHFANISNSLV
ncbi:putative tyrosinase-like protein tyr-1 [Oculina patagonica]